MNNSNMEIKIRKIEAGDRESVLISCHEVDENVKEIVAFVKSKQGQLTGSIEDRQVEIPISDLYYIEAIDNRVFLYGAKSSYESKSKLYELEELLRGKNFLRISKSQLLNLLKVKAIKPAMNSRFIAVLTNGEEIIISRKYVPDLKKKLKGEA